MSKAKRTVWVLGLMLAAGCAASDGGEVEASTQALQASGDAVSFSEFEDPQGTSEAGTEPMRRLIRSEYAYQRLFGHRSPGIDFWREVVVFYSAGVKETGGYHASISEITRVGSRLQVTTSLESPGAGCRVTESLTHPSVLVRVKARGVRSARFDSQDTTRDCECLQNALCVRGFVFDDSPDVCACVPDPNAKRCGGIAGIPCPDGQDCVDDPSDSCDPNNGGADCGGICVGSGEPTNPCAAVLCQVGTVCNDKGECVADPDAKRCGGFAGTACPDGQECIDDPSDSCDPNNGGADCGGICVGGADPCAAVQCETGNHCDENGQCVPNEAPVFCGGIANIQCPGLGQCQDDPYDGCDPMNGGADCGGVCSCEALAKCQAGQVFDRSPNVCSCVEGP